jgi:hypothetical protein
MALNINGTTGISGVDGSASAASIAGTDANTGLSFASDTVNINTGGVTRATVDSAGRFLIGTTTEGEAASDDLTIATDAHTGMTIRSGSSHDCTINFSDATSGSGEYAGWLQYNHTNNHMLIGTNATEKMRIGSDGFVGIGVTSAVANAGGASFVNGDAGRKYLILGCDTSGAKSLIEFNNSNYKVGSVETSGTSTSYNTSSDYRLKENIVGISDGITRLKTLKPYRFNFKTDATTTVDGFFAHEVTAVPEAISGTKDEVDSDNNPVYQGIDQSKLVPLLTAALQEAIAKIEILYPYKFRCQKFENQYK